MIRVFIVTGVIKDMKRLCIFSAVFVSTFVVAANAGNAKINRPIVDLKNGRVQGISDHGMFIYRNIPYAAPPVGEWRWRPPQTVKNWEGILDASKFGQACPQPSIKGLNETIAPGNEDCLKLNVYAPKAAKKAPVMVWIHGGALITGAASESYYEPINLIKEGVIVVTIDYRLGKLGFFAPTELSEEGRQNNESVGNYGLMDQIAALKWVHDNIASFGGDADNVTIFGESAGGRSVVWLMTSPSAKGLFNKAIAESAQQTPLRYQKLDKPGLVSQEEMDAKFISSRGAKDLKDLRSMPADKILVTPQEYQNGAFGGAFIDGSIIIDNPIPLFAEGKQYKIPFMIGTNSWDASFFVPGQPPVDAYLAKMGQDRHIIDNLYADFKNKCALSAEIMADGWYHGSAKLLADSAGQYAPSYAYYFDYLTPKIRTSHPGSPHTFEIPYVFGSMAFVLPPPASFESNTDQCSLITKASDDLKSKAVWSNYWFPMSDARNKEDIYMSEQMSKSWAAFAKTGNPNYNSKINWPAYKLVRDTMREFTHGPNKIIKDLKKDRINYQIRALKAVYGLR